MEMSADHKEAIDSGKVLSSPESGTRAPGELVSWPCSSLQLRTQWGLLHRILGWTNGLLSTDPQRFTKVCKIPLTTTWCQVPGAHWPCRLICKNSF